jgi:acetyltransferase-like isoleucine patch superfamily enzyme
VTAAGHVCTGEESMPTLVALCRHFADVCMTRILSRYCIAHEGVRFLHSASINNKPSNRAAIEVGARCVVGGQLHVYPDGGRISIGECCFIGPGTRIWAGDSVEIGNRVLISHGVNIHDNISHSLSAQERHQHFVEILERRNGALGKVPKQRIVIEDDAWIGFNAIILKGVRIGEGAVVAAGAIVTKDVPPYTIVAGAVAQSIRNSLP